MTTGSADDEDPPARSPRRRARRSRAVAVVAGVALLGFTGLLVLPAARTWLNQRDQRVTDQRKLAFIAAENAKLEDRVGGLQTPDEIERVARQKYNYAYPGEQVVSVLPPPTPGPLPSSWPYNVVAAIVAARAG
jgi:cell division protein FtsB